MQLNSLLGIKSVTHNTFFSPRKESKPTILIYFRHSILLLSNVARNVVVVVCVGGTLRGRLPPVATSKTKGGRPRERKRLLLPLLSPRAKLSSNGRERREGRKRRKEE